MTVFSFFVRVPVLSEQMTEVALSVSMQSIRFTRTDRCAILRAVRDSKAITVAGRPCGTFATIMARNPFTKRAIISSVVFAFLTKSLATKHTIPLADCNCRDKLHRKAHIFLKGRLSEFRGKR